MLSIVLNKPGKACFRATVSHATTFGDMVSLARMGLQNLSADWSQGVEGLVLAT